MIIIRKLSVIFILLVVITSLSFTAFATGEQPSGSNYHYLLSTGTYGFDTYWNAVTLSLVQMGKDVQSIKSLLPSGSTYSYYNGSSRTENYWKAVTNGLAYIGLEAYTIQGDTASIRSSSSDIKTTVNNIKSDLTTIKSNTSNLGSNGLPTGSNYPYFNASMTTDYSNFWSAANSNIKWLVQYESDIYTLASHYEDYLYAIEGYTNRTASASESIDITTGIIDSTTQSIDTSTQSIDTTLQIPADSIYRFANSAGTPVNNSRVNYWKAVTEALTFMGSDIENMRKDLVDLHTMFASPEDLALKADQENNISSATTNFLSGNDSSTSVGTGSIGKVKTLGDGAASFFDTGVNATSLFTLLSDNSNDGPWTWFTQAVADDLDAVAAANRNSRSNSSSESVVDFYSDKMADLDKLLGSIAEVDSRKSENYVYTASDFQQDQDPWEVDIID